MNYEALKIEIETDPIALGYCVDGIRKSGLEILQLINAITPDCTRPQTDVPITKILKWAAQTGALARINDAANDPDSPVRSVALCAVWILQGAVKSVDFSDAENVGMISALTTHGVITEQEQAALISTVQIPCSRAEELFGRLLTADDIERSH